MISPDELDRLIDGELTESGRRDLLRRLDASDGWRRCALAFLEAQSWRSTIRDAVPQPVATVPIVVPWRRPSVSAWMARAAAVLVVFGAGWGIGQNRSTPTENTAREVPPQPTIVAQIDPKPAVVPTVDPPAPPPRPTLSYPEALLERQGYKVEHRRVLVPAQTSNGRRVAVPMEQTRVRFVGNRSV